MDILSQYNKENPEAPAPRQAFQPSGEYGFLVRLTMRLSGGMVRDADQAKKCWR